MLLFVDLEYLQFLIKTTKIEYKEFGVFLYSLHEYTTNHVFVCTGAPAFQVLHLNSGQAIDTL